MDYKSIPFEKRIKENIRNYSLENLFALDALTEYCKVFYSMTGVGILLTERHGEKAISVGQFAGFNPDVVNNPGRKIQVMDRTVAHLYTKIESVSEDKLALTDKLVDNFVRMLSQWGQDAYLHNESAVYLDELEERLGVKHILTSRGEKEDALTGVYNRLYFYDRMKVIDRSEVIPVAVINFNINDWKFVNDNFGDEESDRLICTVAEIIKNESKQDYVIGRVDGDVFNVLIPMVQEEEAEEYCFRVAESCNSVVDERLAPSVAYGIVYKTNVEESIEALLPEAEYEMFNNKLLVKSEVGYRERLTHGIK